MRLDFSNKVILVTGGTKGVGRGIVQGFLALNATVICCARQAPKSLPTHNNNRAIFLPCDVLQLEQITALMEQIQMEYQRLDVVINNAGGAPFAEAATASPRFSEKIIALNLLAPLNISQAANRIMQTQSSGGCIINIASVSALRPSPGTAAYGAAKAGLISLTQSLGVEWAPKVRVNAIAAGLIKTEQSHLHYGDAAGIAAVSETIPLARLAEPEDIANACTYLASDLASYVSGSCLTIHGGGEKPAFLDAANNNH